MILFGEPIGTWISIVAILISLSTLFLAFRKQKYDERTALAGQIADIKNSVGENIRMAKSLLSELEEIENLLGDSKENKNAIDTLRNKRKKMENGISKMNTIFRDLGHFTPKKTDPILLSAILVESNDIGKDIDEIRKVIKEFSLDQDKTVEKK